MRISKSRINNVSQYATLFREGSSVYIVRCLEDIDPKILGQIGFGQKISIGDAVTPKGIGPVSKFNVRGMDYVHKDRPMITVSHTVVGRDWHGNLTLKDRDYDCYPRTHIEAPNTELSVTLINDKMYVTSTAIIDGGDNNNLKHCVNLFLELFGECELLDENKNVLDKDVKVKRLNWQILPEGEYPWKRMSEIAGGIRDTSKLNEAFQKYRYDTMLKFKPDYLYYGNGGFHGYLVFEFKEKGMVLMENMSYGNATYVFKNEDWQELSKLSKAEIIHNDLSVGRIMHDKFWSSRIRKLFL